MASINLQIIVCLLLYLSQLLLSVSDAHPLHKISYSTKQLQSTALDTDYRRDKRGSGYLNSPLFSFFSPHQDSHQLFSSSDIASRAAGQAAAAVASQSHLAHKAAQKAKAQIASQVSLSAQKAHAAATAKYLQASQLTQLAQISQAMLFKEAAKTAKTSQVLHTAEAMKRLSVSQVKALQETLGQAKAQVAIADQVLSAATDAHVHQRQELQQAQKSVQQIYQQQSLVVADLSKAQAAAERAKSAATKALYNAQPVEGMHSYG